MGTDIHWATQRRVDGKWQRVERMVKDEYDGSIGRESLVTDRNYVLFAVLAGVRNGFGFAGVLTHEPVEPIAEGRGLPEDFAAEMVDGSHEGTWMGDHSSTWMLLSEVEAYDWSRSLVQSGWVSAPTRAAQLSRRLRQPQSWCGGISGPRIRHISIGLMDEEIRAGKIDDHAYAELSWEQSLRYGPCEQFLAMLPLFRALADSSDDVRFVMGFDS